MPPTCGGIYGDDGQACPSPEHGKPQLAVEGVSEHAEELGTGVCGQAVHKQTEEDCRQHLAQQHAQPGPPFIPTAHAQETHQRPHTCRGQKRDFMCNALYDPSIIIILEQQQPPG